MNGRYTAVVFNRPLHGRRLRNVRRTLLPAITVFQLGGRWRLLSKTAQLPHLLSKILSVGVAMPLAAAMAAIDWMTVEVQRIRFPGIQNIE